MPDQNLPPARTIEQLDNEIAVLQALREQLVLESTPLVLTSSFLTGWNDHTNERLEVVPRFDLQGDLKITAARGSGRIVTWINRDGAKKLVAHLNRALSKPDLSSLS